MEAIQQTFNGTVSSNGRVTTTISRNGDLVGRMYLEHTLDATAATVNESASDINNIVLEIGGQQIDKHYGHWLEAWAELTENKTGRVMGTNFQVMSGMGMAVINSFDEGATAQANDTAETQVFFQNPNMDGRVVNTPLQFWFNRNPGLALPLIALQYHEVKVIIEFNTIQRASPDYQLWADYIYLDTDERRRFAQVSHEYLIEQVQYSSFTRDSTFELNFNHPVKELVMAGNWTSGQFARFAPVDTTTRLVLNGHDRFAARTTQYFTRTQVWQHHSAEGGFVEDSIGVYSFALKPEEHQPSGTCNFSRIDNAQLKLSGNSTGAVNIYAVNYNVLRIMSGMGGLAYSN
tara:strand:- start:3372 stop:4412 length:1041 start_codon:yes stop_codon:yes gene_type:complete